MSVPQSYAVVGGNTLYKGDGLDVLPHLPACSVDALVTDPPAGIAFMGKKWDTDKGGRDAWVAYMAERFAAALRVVKPGAFGLFWTLPRTSHWTGWALETAGWEVCDSIAHLFGTGWPKQGMLSHALERTLTVRGADGRRYYADGEEMCRQPPFRHPDADVVHGLAGALKPSREDWILACRPLRNTVAANVLEHGTGVLNIEASRIRQEGRSRVVLVCTQRSPHAGAPVELMRYLTRLITPRGGVVLDIFGGSGTTGVACTAEGFRCITVESDAEPGSCDTTVARWSEASGPLFAALSRTPPTAAVPNAGELFDQMERDFIRGLRRGDTAAPMHQPCDDDAPDLFTEAAA